MENLSLASEFDQGSGSLPHYQFHKRAWERPGCIIDLGCVGWDWSRCFLGKKRVIGADPLEATTPVGAELFRGFVGSFSLDGRMISLESLLAIFKIDQIDLLKMNIEGMEYDILIRMQEPIADQLVVSFHDYRRSGISNPKATEAVLQYLSQWYDWCPSSKEWGWYVLLRR